MRILGVGRYATVLCTAAATLASCGAPPPIGAPGALQQSRIATTHAVRGGSWMLPEAQSEDLLYLVGLGRGSCCNGIVLVYSYPSGKFVGKLTGLKYPNGACVDSKGDVFITDQNASNILEYAHGGTTPLQTLKDSNYLPWGCSVDPTTGNLAVANFCDGNYQCNGSGGGNLIVFTGAKGKPKTYRDGYYLSYYTYCGYDDKGNLFIDGGRSGSIGIFGFIELPKGRKTFTNIKLSQQISYPGAVQWDGNHVAVGDGTSTIYQFAVSGKSGVKVGSTQLLRAGRVIQFWTQSGVVVGPEPPYRRTGLWKYPAGGEPQRVLGARWFEPTAATVSLAQH